jgi:hypothetical protein
MRVLQLLALLALLAAVLWPLVRGWSRGFASEDSNPRDELVKDPMCESYVVRSKAVRRQFGRVPLYFCSEACADRYVRGGRLT